MLHHTERVGLSYRINKVWELAAGVRDAQLSGGISQTCSYNNQQEYIELNVRKTVARWCGRVEGAVMGQWSTEER